jgi:pyruvate/2-oxoglutarate dehydrogenase complex dihydrolipoamide acyltransferase (E2) component
MAVPARSNYGYRIGNIEAERNRVNMAMNILRLPDLGASTGEAEVVVWLKTVGESITAGEPVLEVQSDKANVEVEAAFSGTLARVLAEEGKILKPGDPLAVIAEPDDPRDAAAIDRALVELNG